MAAVDIKNGTVVHSGWLAATEFSAAEAVDKLFAMGFSSFLVTQTERDGMMSGTDASVYGSLAARGRFIAAAGGVTDLHDIRALAAAGVDAAVVGKSLYEGGITLAEALDACSESVSYTHLSYFIVHHIWNSLRETPYFCLIVEERRLPEDEADSPFLRDGIYAFPLHAVFYFQLGAEYSRFLHFFQHSVKSRRVQAAVIH